MSINKLNPLSINAVGLLESKSLDEQVQKLYKEVIQAQDSRSDWI